MAETTLLRSSAIVRNALVGSTPPHGPVKTGELPLVQVRMTPGGPQVQAGQQKPVQILPSKDPKGPVTEGGLPMVQIKMTQNGPQLDDGRDQPVLIKNSKHGAVSAGGLPMVQVKMTQSGPQVQNAPQQQSMPPQIPGAAPVLSAPRVASTAVPAANRGYVARPVHGYVARAAAPTGQPRVARIAAPQVELPPVPELTTDQLMLCRHAVDKELRAMLADDPRLTATDPPAEAPPESDAVKVAKATIATIDDIMVATAVRAEAAEKAAAAAAAAAAAPVAATVASSAAASISPAPHVTYTAGRVSYAGARVQRNAGMAPRRIARPASPLPPVIVKMDGQRAVVQNQAEIAAAKEAQAQAQTEAQVQPPIEATSTPIAAPEAAAPPSPSPQATEGGGQG